MLKYGETTGGRHSYLQASPVELQPLKLEGTHPSQSHAGSAGAFTSEIGR